MDYGHWKFPYNFDPADWHGFIYRIKEVNTGREYIGKKSFWSTTRKKVKGRKNRKTVRKESDWKSYTSSSTHVNDGIKTNGMDNYEFYIESLHKTKASWSYAEVRKHILEDVLRATLADGNRKYLNGQISAVKYLPPKETAEEEKMRIDSFLVEHKKI